MLNTVLIRYFFVSINNIYKFRNYNEYFNGIKTANKKNWEWNKKDHM